MGMKRTNNSMEGGSAIGIVIGLATLGLAAASLAGAVKRDSEHAARHTQLLADMDLEHNLKMQRLQVEADALARRKSEELQAKINKIKENNDDLENKVKDLQHRKTKAEAEDATIVF